MNNKNKRPIFLNLLKIRLPVTGVVSILHRVTGMLLALAIPLFIYIFDLSVRGEQSYGEAVALMTSIPVKLVASLLVWALAHHLIAGVRFLLIDLDVGVKKGVARKTAWMTHIVTAVVALSAIGGIWL